MLKSSIIKFHINITANTPVTESVNASLASRLPSNLTIFVVELSQRLMTFTKINGDRDLGFGGGG